VCGGFGPKGLPVGIQLIAKPFEEPVLFRAAHAYEQAAGWRDRRPEPVLAAAA
jgi:aspartyl-tRNA(Asn)/glutamyl-tRNA(Gln) amidotransferase subunit A